MPSDKRTLTTFGGIDAGELIEKYGSPLYVYEEDVIRRRFNELRSAISYPKTCIHYAAKANSNHAVLSLLNELGSGIDATSPGEVFLSLKAGFSPKDIIFTGVNSSPFDLAYCHEAGVQVNIGSLRLLEYWGQQYPGTKVSVRINPDIGAGHHDHTITGGPASKFGIYHDRINDIKQIAGQHDLDITGVHSHIGSGILQQDVFIKAMKIILDTAQNLEGLQFVDIGGGIGVPYSSQDHSIDLIGLCGRISDTFSNFCKLYGADLELKLEPGRYIVAESGALLTTVTNLKETPKYSFVGVDSGFNHLQRPVMYGSYHEIQNASHPNAERSLFVVGGNLCESGDVFTRDEKGISERLLPIPEIGDILVIRDCGAYGYSMASNYNSRLLPAEVMVSKGISRLVRRRQTLNDIMWGDI
ncbi:MAG: diaminopimelate decarboxylase [Candidatus Methanofastidiosia archaeon]